MYRVFADGKCIGEYISVPYLGGKNYYLYYLKNNRWYLQTSTNYRSIDAEQIPKEYRALNLLL